MSAWATPERLLELLTGAYSIDSATRSSLELSRRTRRRAVATFPGPQLNAITTPLPTASPQYASSVADRLADLARGLNDKDDIDNSGAAEPSGGASSSAAATTKAPPGQVDLLWRIAGMWTGVCVYIHMDRITTHARTLYQPASPHIYTSKKATSSAAGGRRARPRRWRWSAWRGPWPRKHLRRCSLGSMTTSEQEELLVMVVVVVDASRLWQQQQQYTVAAACCC